MDTKEAYQEVIKDISSKMLDLNKGRAIELSKDVTQKDISSDRSEQLKLIDNRIIELFKLRLEVFKLSKER